MKKKVLNEEEVTERKKLRGKGEEYRKGLDYEDGNKVVKWFGSFVQLIDNYGIKRMIQAFILIVACVSFMIFANAMNNEEIIESWLTREIDIHAEGTDIRTEITPKVNASLIKMMYELEGDRTCVLEMHNGKENPTSLPFNYCDMTYEQTRDRIPYIAEEYEDLNMSKFEFPYYLYEHKIFVGSIDDIYNLDKKLAMRLEMNDVKYVGIVVIRGTDDIGFLMVSYLDKPTVTDETITTTLIYYVQEVGAYLDYHVQSERRKNKK